MELHMRVFILVLLVGGFSALQAGGLPGLLIFASVLGLAVIFGVAAFAWKMVTPAEAAAEPEVEAAEPEVAAAEPEEACLCGGLCPTFWQARLWANDWDFFLNCGAAPARCDRADNDCDGGMVEEPKFLPMRRGRGQEWWGNAERRACYRSNRGSDWKLHRKTQWR